MSQRRSTSGRRQGAGQNYGRRQSFLARTASGFFRYVINSAAYSLRIFLRIRLGERAIGIPTVLLSFVWICYFLTYTYMFDFNFNQEQPENPWFDIPAFIQPFILILSFIGQLLMKVFQAFLNAARVLGLAEPGSGLDSSLYWDGSVLTYGLLCLLFGVIHLIKIQLRATSKTHVHSYSHGKSAFFWWLEGRKFPWFRTNSETGRLTIRSVKIVEKTIFTYVEPIFVFLIGMILRNGGSDHFGWFLIVSAIALFWDERKESASFRGQVLDMLDGEMDGKALIEEYKKVKGEAEQGGNFKRGARIPL